MFLPDVVVFWLAAAGVVIAILGNRKLGGTLLIPAATRWVVWPAAAPLVSHWIADMPPVLLTAFAVATPLIILLLAIRLLQNVTSLSFGSDAGSHVAAVYLVRMVDSLGRAIWRLISLPFRLHRGSR